MTELNADISKKANYWASSEVFSPSVRSEIETLISASDNKELTDRFYKDLEFGTGGLRGIMGAGTSRMNIYNIRKASTALAMYLKEIHSDKEIKVAISHDSRNRSREFSKAAAEVLSALGIKVYITKEMRPVPVLSYMTRHYGCDAGICVTASHNPPAYNGFKVYWSNGAQLIGPHDKNIIQKYGSITSYEDLKFSSYEEMLSEGKIEEIGEELDQLYLDELAKLRLNTPETSDAIRIAYSPIHGTGVTMVPKAFELFGFKDYHLVEEQSTPDGNFPTVNSPNPEDPEALKMAIELGEKKDADIILATDPDTDRIAVLVRENGKLINFNGNQLGCLLIDYVLRSHKENATMPENPLVVKTIVTTKLQDEICAHYGVDCEDTLTGFKWICNLVERYEKGELGTKKTFVCGGEESYGFLAGNFVRDKDAVMGCAIACEMVAYYKSKGKLMSEVLNEIYLRHGVYHETLYTMTLPGKEGADKISAIMQNFREAPPTSLCGISVSELWDYKSSKKYSVSEKGVTEISNIDLPNSNVLQLFLSDGSKVSVRPSGTEPKIKFYMSVKRELSNEAELDQKITEAKQLASDLEKEFVALSN
jgi:phosphoglucomutase